MADTVHKNEISLAKEHPDWDEGRVSRTANTLVKLESSPFMQNANAQAAKAIRKAVEDDPSIVDDPVRMGKLVNQAMGRSELKETLTGQQIAQIDDHAERVSHLLNDLQKMRDLLDNPGIASKLGRPLRAGESIGNILGAMNDTDRAQYDQLLARVRQEGPKLMSVKILPSETKPSEEEADALFPSQRWGDTKQNVDAIFEDWQRRFVSDLRIYNAQKLGSTGQGLLILGGSGKPASAGGKVIRYDAAGEPNPVTITAESADGTTHEFPDGTDQTVVDRVMKDYAMKGAAPPPPAVPPPSATPAKPIPQMPPMQHIASAMGEAFAPPYGVSTETVFPWVKGHPVLGAVLGMPVEGISTAVDLMGRPVQALTKGAAAAGAEIARAGGATPTSQEQIERDLNVAGEGAQIETMRAPAVPKLSVTTDTAGGVKAIGQKIGRAAQDSPLAEPVAKAFRWFWDVDKTDPEKIAAIHDIVNTKMPPGVPSPPRVPIESWAPAATYLSRLTAIARGWGYDPVKEAASAVL